MRWGRKEDEEEEDGNGRDQMRARERERAAVPCIYLETLFAEDFKAVMLNDRNG
jgi:hypothetical protein